MKIFPMSGDAPQGYASRLSKRDLPTVADRGEEQQSLLKNWVFSSFNEIASILFQK